jgi:hypothetical protein
MSPQVFGYLFLLLFWIIVGLILWKNLGGRR